MAKSEAVVKKFYDGLDEGKFLAKKCPKCGNVEFPPNHACNECGNLYNDWIELSGDVVINEVYKLAAAFILTQFTPYAPLFGAEVRLAEGSEFYSLVFGVDNDIYPELVKNPSVDGKLVVMPMDGYNTFAVAINGAVPVRKGEAKQTADNAAWNAMRLSEVEGKVDEEN